MSSILLIVSSWMSDCNENPRKTWTIYLGVLLRIIGKIIAYINGIGFIAHSIFNCIGLYRNCYCKASAINVRKFPWIDFLTSNDIKKVAQTRWLTLMAFSIALVSVYIIGTYISCRKVRIQIEPEGEGEV